MLVLNPRRVVFAGTEWPGVTLVAVDREATRVAVEWGDAGPHPTFADVTEQRVGVRVVIELGDEDVGSPVPGAAGTLSFHTSRSGSEGGRRRVSMSAVVTGVSHELSLKRGAVRTIDLVAVSADGAADPVTLADTGAE